MMPTIIRDLALQALDDDEALPVLGDAVLATGWFDPRVVCTMWGPPRPSPRNGFRSKKARTQRRADMNNHEAGYPDYFAAYASKPTKPWARAIVAVALFGAWRVRGWPLTNRSAKVYPDYPFLYSSVTVDRTELINRFARSSDDRRPTHDT